MAKVTKFEQVSYTLELSEEEAQYLRAALMKTDTERAGLGTVDPVFRALIDAGVGPGEFWAEGSVLVRRG